MPHTTEKKINSHEECHPTYFEVNSSIKCLPICLFSPFFLFLKSSDFWDTRFLPDSSAVCQTKWSTSLVYVKVSQCLVHHIHSIDMKKVLIVTHKYCYTVLLYITTDVCQHQNIHKNPPATIISTNYTNIQNLLFNALNIHLISLKIYFFIIVDRNNLWFTASLLYTHYASVK